MNRVHYAIVGVKTGKRALSIAIQDIIQMERKEISMRERIEDAVDSAYIKALRNTKEENASD